MKAVSQRHRDNTWIETLWRWYTIIRKKIIIIFTILFFVSSFLIFSFFHNDLFYKIWLYDNKETLDTNTF